MLSGADDDVSSSTVAARSSKTWDVNTMNSTAKGAVSEGMNATMTTIDAGEKLNVKPPMVSVSSELIVYPPDNCSTFPVPMFKTPEEKIENAKLVKIYQSCKFKRFHFLKPEPFQNESLTSDYSRHRIQEDLNYYKHYKGCEKLLNIDGGLTYYVISSAWINKWREFVTNKGPYPGPVHNKDLVRRVYEHRFNELANNYTIHDNEIDFMEERDIFVLSKDFWSMFEERYGVDIVIQLRKYRDMGSMQQDVIKSGTFWTALHTEPTQHYDPMI